MKRQLLSTTSLVKSKDGTMSRINKPASFIHTAPLDASTDKAPLRPSGQRVAGKTDSRSNQAGIRITASLIRLLFSPQSPVNLHSDVKALQ